MELAVREIRKSFSGTEILHGISFTVHSGRAMGFLGRNGAGKSTTFRCLLQVFRQDSGEFLLDGRPFEPRRHRLGYLPEERGMYGKATLRDQLTYFAQLKGALRAEAQREADDWIHYFDLDRFRDKPLETLSKGNQQKVQIAQAFLNDPELVILDEPFSGLDPVNALVFQKAIRRMVSAGKLVIFSSHQMAYVEELCDEITLIDQGRILLTGNLEDIRSREGENRYYIDCRQDCLAAVTEYLKGAGMAYTVKGTRIMTVRQDEIMKKIIARYFDGITGWGRYRPTLQEIFIEHAGEEQADA
jgi:ABC-2 type transport system ATP-binding protein